MKKCKKINPTMTSANYLPFFYFCVCNSKKAINLGMTSAKNLRPISFYLLCIVWQSSKMGNIFLGNWSRLFPFYKDCFCVFWLLSQLLTSHILERCSCVFWLLPHIWQIWHQASWKDASHWRIISAI